MSKEQKKKKKKKKKREAKKKKKSGEKMGNRQKSKGLVERSKSQQRKFTETDMPARIL